MTQHHEFLDLVLDDEGLHTPDGVIALADLTAAEVVRHRSRDGGTPRDSYNAEVAGAVLGGAAYGVAGVIGGALLGNALARDNAAGTGVPRTVSATMTFVSPGRTYSRTVDRIHASDAEAFVAAVKQAAGLT